MEEQAGAFGGILGLGSRPALVVVDVVQAYLVDGSPLRAPVERAVDAAVRLIESARENGVPVIFTNVRYTPGGRDGGHFYRKVPALSVFDAGSPLGEFVPDLDVDTSRDLIVTKQYASAFFGTSLAATLTSLQTDSVVVAGLTTSGCVRATALDALQYGFAPTVVSDAVGDRTQAVHAANLFDLSKKYADVVDADRVMREWSPVRSSQSAADRVD